MYSPLVSIIIPVYNGSNFLKQAVDSALNQTYPNIEILIINDGSDDDCATEKIALSYGDKIRYFHKENGGVSSALNLGISQMKGEWFSWLSHDDLYLKDKILHQVEAAEEALSQYEKFIVLCNYKLINAEGQPIPRRPYPLRGTLSGRKMFLHRAGGYILNGCTMLIPRRAFQENGNFDESLRYIQDVEYWTRLMLNNYYFVINNDADVRMRVHENQVTVKKANQYYLESKCVSIPLSDRLLANYDRDKALLNAFLCMMVKYNHKEVAGHIIGEMRKRNLFSANLRLKILLFRMVACVRPRAKSLYYSLCAHSSR